MNGFYLALFFILQYSMKLKADIPNNNPQNWDPPYLSKDPEPMNCTTIVNAFAQYASDLTRCSIMYARPITLCENCIKEYMNFHTKYQELLTTVVNGTSCKSMFISQDRLDAVLEYHDNILSIWDKGHCNACYDWSNPAAPTLSNQTVHFNTLYKETNNCIQKYTAENKSEVCNKCMQEYLQLDDYYKTLSEDAVGVDSICMDVFDSMNATRSTWSKTYNCCKLRRSPEIIFLCCAAIISALPLFYYIMLRYCGPIRDFPNVLKQSRFKQTILRSINRRIN
ncbi:unnamed protein product [Arctia plantaginis]|uniref:Osteopetrosis-associated transmembrane protein 1 n=1 Tax=Arctia plantaginis TaxID=874455 RepID=A0A8S1ADQ9_ARCPL|nr:unnamed protein product [Arctia plantaginis]CAB3243308.1 unnamed protein product [Arctia plantaginis]